MPEKKDPSERYMRMNITLPPKLRERLKDYCIKNDRQMSQVIKRAVTEFLDTHENKPEPGWDSEGE